MVGYLISLGTFTAVFALFSLGLNLQWGYTGLINFGQVAFLGLGAYTTILLSIAGVPLPITVLLGALLAALLGLGIGVSTLRLREDYLAIVTIGVAEVLQRVGINEEWLTRGSRGVYGYPLPLKNFEPSGLILSGMVGILLTIFGIVFWRFWQWLQQNLQTQLRSSLWTKILAFVAYVGCVIGVEYSFWYWLTPLLDARQFSPMGFLLTIVFTLASIAVVLASSRQPLATARQQPWTRYLLLATGTLAMAVLAMVGRAVIISLGTGSYKARLLWLLILVLAFIFWQLERWVASPWGRVLKSIREDEEVPKALGKNVFAYKLQSFMLGGAITGIAGSFYAWELNFIEPKGTFDSLLTFQAWTIVVLGGAGNNVGVLVGAAIFWAYNTLSRFILPALLPLDADKLGALRVMIIGLILIVMMMWRPQGMLGNKEELTLGR